MTNGEAVNWLINITADIGKTEHQELWHYEQALTEIKEMLETVPQRMRGRWVGIDFDGYADGNPVYYTWKCSVCNCLVEDEEPTWDFCPNCGADMRGKE